MTGLEVKIITETLMDISSVLSRIADTLDKCLKIEEIHVSTPATLSTAIEWNNLIHDKKDELI
jgi:hypothetical protein